MLLDMIQYHTFNIPSPIYTVYFPLIQLTTQSSRKLKQDVSTMISTECKAKKAGYSVGIGRRPSYDHH